MKNSNNNWFALILQHTISRLPLTITPQSTELAYSTNNRYRKKGGWKYLLQNLSVVKKEGEKKLIGVNKHI